MNETRGIKYNFYIRSENRNSKLESVLNTIFQTYKVKIVMGYWKNKPEKTAIIEITTNAKLRDRTIEHILNRIKEGLKQKDILFTSERLIQKMN